VSLEASAPAFDLAEVAVTGNRQSLEAKMSELGDYKLYTLPEPTTIAARQSKQVRFLSQANVPFTRVYTFELDPNSLTESPAPTPQPAIATLRLLNRKSEGLGKPLPAGVISVMEGIGPKNDSSRVFAGEDTLDDTPVGLPIEIEMGRAMDVWIEPRVTADKKIEEKDFAGEQAEIEVRLRNDKPIAILLEYRQPGARRGFKVVRESRTHRLKNGDPQWSFKLPPGARAVLTYTVRKVD
jgi:hypothetical protein